MATKSNTKKTSTVSADPRIEKYEALASLSDALVREIDNVMTKRLAPGQLGHLLGTIVTAYKEQSDEIKGS